MGAVRIGDIDLTVGAEKAHREPFLFLATIFAVPGLANEVARNIVSEPFHDLADPLDRANVGFLAQFPHRRRPWLLAGVDTALRQLPEVGEIDVAGTAETAAD